jgi:hypothetical protein
MSLIDAVKEGNLDNISDILRECKNEQSTLNAALFEASLRNSVDAARLLIAFGAQASQDFGGATALDVAMSDELRSLLSSSVSSANITNSPQTKASVMKRSDDSKPNTARSSRSASGTRSSALRAAAVALSLEKVKQAKEETKPEKDWDSSVAPSVSPMALKRELTRSESRSSTSVKISPFESDVVDEAEFSMPKDYQATTLKMIQELGLSVKINAMSLKFPAYIVIRDLVSAISYKFGTFESIFSEFDFTGRKEDFDKKQFLQRLIEAVDRGRQPVPSLLKIMDVNRILS